ncbi:restriction endonuclease fold toxin [Marinomonas transparens]|uniref:VENN motif pre-toxin domain-containing protein n=1 Tax=Marinomonas transparens TaxID=2795388 RepID=A0A934N4G1_9GAMM|nr:restriction endonuclease fold toxin [Marinomonas transparens]MBJ7540053.1 VENN motif pre-toxin domain-containing protein [Marinomonas transparens]
MCVLLITAGAEAAAPALAEWLYGSSNPDDLKADEKQTLTAILGAASTAVGATTGNADNAIAAGQAGENAVENNYFGHMDESGKIDAPIVKVLKEQETAYKDEHCVGLSQADCSGAYANHQREQLQDIPIVGSVAAVGQCLNGNDAACNDIVINVATDAAMGLTGAVFVKVGGEVIKYTAGKLDDVAGDTYALVKEVPKKGEAPKDLNETFSGGRPTVNGDPANPSSVTKNSEANRELYGEENATDAFPSGTGNAYDGGLIKVDVEDADADALANHLGGRSSVRFKNDPVGKEFDAVSDQYIAEAKPAFKSFGKDERIQAKRAFEAAKETGRDVYYHFNGEPGSSVIRQLEEYSKRYDIKVVIDTKPF